MDSNVYINNNDVIETYFVRVNESEVKNIQSKIDSFYGKGTLIIKKGVTPYILNDPEYFGKKIQIIFKKKVGRGKSFDYCCPSVDEVDLFDIEFYAYRQCALSKICDILLNGSDRLELSRCLKKLLQYKSERAEDRVFVDALIKSIKFEKIDCGELIKSDISVEQKKNIFHKIIKVIRNKSDEPLILSSTINYEKDVEKEIRTRECYVHALGQHDDNFKYDEEDRKKIKKSILDSLPTKSEFIKRI